MYSQDEQNIIILGAQEASSNFVSLGVSKDEIGCESHLPWTLAWHIMKILETLNRATTDALTSKEENCLYERLIYFKNVNI